MCISIIYFLSRVQRFDRFSNKGQYWNEITFEALVSYSKRDVDVRQLLETVFLVTSEPAVQLERSCQEIGANRLAADRALYSRLNENDANLTQMASLLLPFYIKNYAEFKNHLDTDVKKLKGYIKDELHSGGNSFGIDQAVSLGAKFSCLAVIFDQFDPVAHRVKYTIRQEFVELLVPSDRSWFMDLAGVRSLELIYIVQ